MKQFQSHKSPEEMRNLIITVILCTALLMIWQVFYQQPKMKQESFARQQAQELQDARLAGQRGGSMPDSGDALPTQAALADAIRSGQNTAELSALPRETLLAASSRVRINTPALHGSINLDGLRFDDLTLVRHRVEVDPNSPEVVLLTPSQMPTRYFMQVGWLADKGETVELPGNATRWQADRDTLTPEAPVTLNWTNPQGITFRVIVSVDRDYLFTLKQEVVNASGKPLNILPYGLINHAMPAAKDRATVIHQGPIAVLDDKLVEVNYTNLKSEEKESYADAKGWVGVADKYWLTAFMPPQNEAFNTKFHYVAPEGVERVQVDYLATKPQSIQPGQTGDYTLHIFAGAKELPVLDKYMKELNLPLFDRALDFGTLYFLTRPIFEMLDYFYGVLGNFGLAIMLMVVILKLVLYPLTNKSYRSMAQMRTLQPKMEKLKKEHGEDRVRMQQEMMKLYQQEKINPVSGCLPMIIQIPVFFALYKVLMVSIEMRHAPFYGWVQDLSAMDHTNLFTLFGLIPWSPPAIMHLGAWPIIMAITMFLQQKMNPKPADPVQAKVMGFLPLIFLVLFASFPAGLLIYWSWSNFIGIIQQWFINRSYEKHKRKKAAKRAALEASNEA